MCTDCRFLAIPDDSSLESDSVYLPSISNMPLFPSALAPQHKITTPTTSVVGSSTVGVNGKNSVGRARISPDLTPPRAGTPSGRRHSKTDSSVTYVNPPGRYTEAGPSSSGRYNREVQRRGYPGERPPESDDGTHWPTQSDILGG